MMNDVLPSGTVLPNTNKQDHSNSSREPSQQQTGSTTVGGPNNSNLSLAHAPFTGGSGGAGGGNRVTNSGGPGGQATALERLNRRVGGYRARQDEHLPKYNNTMHSINNQHSGETLLLRQKFLESTKNKKVRIKKISASRDSPNHDSSPSKYR